MLIRLIKDFTRVCGKSQGFLGLPVRDIIIEDSVMGTVAAQETAWEPTPEELLKLNNGASVVVRIVGREVGAPPFPMMVVVEDQ